MIYQKWLDKNYKDLTNKTVIVTGANSGIGFETCIYLAYMNANIIMACRNKGRADKARNKILELFPHCNIEIYIYDQSSFKSIDLFVDELSNKNIEIYGLIMNAGIYFPKADYVTEDGFELTFGTNYLGGYYLLKRIKNLLNKYSSRVVIVSSLTATTYLKKNSVMEYSKLSRNDVYGYSKLCLSRLFNEEYNQVNKNYSIRLVHPGICATNILHGEKTGLPNWFSKVGHDFLFLFVHKANKAALSLIKGLLDEEAEKPYICPRGAFAISGYPKKKRIPKKFKYQNIVNETEELLKKEK